MTEASDANWMRHALAEAERATQHGDVPIGAILVDREGREVGRGHNERELAQDPTAHAEIVALRRAAQRAGHWRLEGATLFVTLEPCAMCAGALVNARVARLVYGAADPKAGAVESLFSVATDSRLNHRLVVTSGVERDAALSLLRGFFAKLRRQGQK